MLRITSSPEVWVSRGGFVRTCGVRKACAGLSSLDPQIGL